ncbi:2-isopropylmalate synthase [bacterium]|nr:2-isopropylmalate synthase [bacterium]
MSKNNNIIIFDTTLRDGEQSPGCSLNLEEKLRMARQLVRLKVDVIEAGFPEASPGDFRAVQEIAKQIKGPIICGLARANKKNIKHCDEALAPAKKKRIHTFISSSDIHLKYQLKKTRAQVLKQAITAVSYARSLCSDVEFSAMDASRSDPKYLLELYQAVIDAGALTINIPDTVGYSLSNEFYKLVYFLNENLKKTDKVSISVHCHNDLGLAVANSLASIQAGATQVECTVNGIGERAGNCSLEEVVMGIYVRKDLFPYQTKIDKKQIYRSSRLLSALTGIDVQPNKPIVGENAFAHEAGIHQDGVLKNKTTYEIIRPQVVGVPSNKLVLGKHSGRHALQDRLRKLGYQLGHEELRVVFSSFKRLSDVKKKVFDDDLIALVDSHITHDQRYVLDSIQVVSGNFAVPAATISLAFDGSIKKESAVGDGPVDAAFQAIKKLTGFKGRLTHFSVRSITGGTDAQGGVFVAIEKDGKVMRATSSHTDIIVASAEAFITAINKFEHYHFKDKPEQIKGC